MNDGQQPVRIPPLTLHEVRTPGRFEIDRRCRSEQSGQTGFCVVSSVGVIGAVRILGEIVGIARLVFEEVASPREQVSPPIVSLGGRANEKRLATPCEIGLLAIRTIVAEQRIDLEGCFSDRGHLASNQHSGAVPKAVRHRTRIELLAAVVNDMPLVKQRDRR